MPSGLRHGVRERGWIVPVIHRDPLSPWVLDALSTFVVDLVNFHATTGHRESTGLTTFSEKILARFNAVLTWKELPLTMLNEDLSLFISPY